jgi:hypothetical protein
VTSEPYAERYERLFGIPFETLLPAVRDDYVEEFGARELPQCDDKQPFRLFVSGSMGPLFYPSLRCMAQAFHFANIELGRPLQLAFSGTWKKETLEELGFDREQLVPLGWLPSKRDVLMAAASASCSYMPGIFDENYEAKRWEFPSRISDYLITGPPILAHTHPTSAVAHYFNKHDIPFLCVTLNPRDLAQKLVSIAKLTRDEGENTRRRYVALAKEYHLGSKTRAALLGEDQKELAVRTA